jgi:hypothetical protein
VPGAPGDAEPALAIEAPDALAEAAADADAGAHAPLDGASPFEAHVHPPPAATTKITIDPSAALIPSRP